jgi:hypothetical protein
MASTTDRHQALTNINEETMAFLRSNHANTQSDAARPVSFTQPLSHVRLAPLPS